MIERKCVTLKHVTLKKHMKKLCRLLHQDQIMSQTYTSMSIPLYNFTGVLLYLIQLTTHDTLMVPINQEDVYISFVYMMQYALTQ